jgi:hypothetical protein
MGLVLLARKVKNDRESPCPALTCVIPMRRDIRLVSRISLRYADFDGLISINTTDRAGRISVAVFAVESVQNPGDGHAVSDRT